MRDRQAPRWKPGIELRSSAVSPLGSLPLHGYLPGSVGSSQGAGRKLGRYALVLSLRGRCDYWDERVGRRVLGPGDAFLVFPEVAHRYGGARPGDWDEMFVVFEGPAFDLLRATGLIRPEQPFLRLEPVPVWRRRLEACVGAGDDPGPEAAGRRVHALVGLLLDAVAAQRRGQRRDPPWLDEARERLGRFDAPRVKLRALARELGVSFETFRKGFAAATGVSPGAWRGQRQVEEAARLLAGGELSGKEVAARLGFSDEYHFSRRFKALAGMTPSAFRRRTRSR